ncbi:fatty acyl-CoA reductase wat-like isoform X2 [Vespula maculifrons]|uniref:Fatty acyl-CoA reductase n=1 Tax=Vespula maculifrons TaxID=7453 RepID=A0ABD2BPK8_VESMC
MIIEDSALTSRTPTEYALTDMEPSIENVKKPTPIQNFYNGQSIFITGGTGFIGKLLIEKLLRGCPDILCIYVMIRPKKEKNLSQRMKELIDDSLFSTLKKTQPTFLNRLVAIEGDCSLPNLGISKTDRTTLIHEVSIIFHVAATVRFNEKLKSAVAINIQSLNDVINLSKEMPKLKSFIHVSTAFANCIHELIEEKFYDPPMDVDQIFDLTNYMDEKLLNDITPQLLGTYPNTYVFTKSIAESVVRKHVDSMPIGIFRPAIVISTYQEPIPGWIDNTHGPIGITANVLMGLMRTHYCDRTVKANFVPADLIVNGLIVSAWDIANNRRFKKDLPIYNYVSDDNPITYNEFVEVIIKYGELIPSEKALWCHSFLVTKYRLVHLFYVYFLHLLPALIIDTIAVCVGKQPWLLQTYKRIHKMSDLLGYFSTTECIYTNERWNKVIAKLSPEDRKLFFCDIKDLVWGAYFPTYFLGIRKYIFKDPIETLPQARIKWLRSYWIDLTLKILIACVFLVVIWATFGSF